VASLAIITALRVVRALTTGKTQTIMAATAETGCGGLAVVEWSQ